MVDLTKKQQAGFDKCYAVYPKKKDIGAAEKAWKKLNPVDELVSEIFNALIAQNLDRKRNPVDKQYLPSLGPWLNSKKWLDHIETSGPERQQSSGQKCACGGEVAYAHENLCVECKAKKSRASGRREIAAQLEKMGLYKKGDNLEKLNEVCRKFLLENKGRILTKMMVK